MSAIKIFYQIWGVSAQTALDFYNKGWRDIDDLVDNWSLLQKSQQIGVKYYGEFLDKISRTEVESIADTVLEHANRIHYGFQLTIVGGYRRGKSMSGDVDLMLSHTDEEATRDLIGKLVESLEGDEHRNNQHIGTLLHTSAPRYPRRAAYMEFVFSA